MPAFIVKGEGFQVNYFCFHLREKNKVRDKLNKAVSKLRIIHGTEKKEKQKHNQALRESLRLMEQQALHRRVGKSARKPASHTGEPGATF